MLPAFSKTINDLSIKQKALISALILFFIHPFSALILAIKDYRYSFAKNIVWIFVAYYGFTLVISNEGMDANRYRDYFIILSNTKVTIENFVRLLYQEGSNYVDAVQPLISFLISRFTKDSKVLFAVFGLVFGFFYSRNIWFLLDRAGSGIKQSSLIYIIVFAVIIGFWQINGFRMWTAAHVFFFGTIQYLMENKKTGILIASTSIFFHFSFMFPVALLLAFLVLPKKVFWFYWFFVVTFFISEIDIRIVGDTLSKLLPGIFLQRVEGFTNPDYVDAVTEGLQTRNWRYHLYGISIKWVATLFLSVIYFSGRELVKENRNINVLFCFALFFIAAVNMVSNVPSVGRFYSVAYLFAFAFIFLYLQQASDFRFKKLILSLSFPLLLFYCMGMVNISLMTIGLITMIGNPIIALLPLGDMNSAIIDLLR